MPAAAAAAAPARRGDWLGRACRWRDRLSVLRMALPLLARAGASWLAADDVTRRVERPCRRGCEHAGQGPTLRVAVGAARRSRRSTRRRTRRGAQPFVRVLARCSGRTATRRRSRCRPAAAPDVRRAGARVHRARTAGRCAPARWRASRRRRRRRGRRRSRRARSRPTAGVIAAVPWFALRTLLRTAAPALLSHDRRQRRGDGLQADRDGQPVVRPPGDGGAVRRPARAARCSGCSTSAWHSASRASHLSLVVERRRQAGAASQRRADRLAAREVAEAMPGARAATLLRGTVIREKRATFSLAPGQPPRPGRGHAVRGSGSRRRLDRHGPSGHDRERRRQRPPRRAAQFDDLPSRRV